MSPLVDILRISVENSVHQTARPGRTVDVHRWNSSLDPRGEDHISQSKRVIGMKMCKEHSVESRRRLSTRCARSERLHSIAPCRGGAANDSSTGIEEIRHRVDNNCDS